MLFWRKTSVVAITAASLVIVQISLFYYQTQRSYITERIDLRSFGAPKYPKMKEQRIIFPRFSLDDVDPLWRQNALLLSPKIPFVKRNLTIGIVTAKRPNGISYLYDTLESLVNNTDSNDLSSICIVILLADFDVEWRNNVARIIKEKYPSMIRNGTILLLQSFNWMYPRLENLTHHYIGHSESRVKWKAKQNIDFAFLWLYVFKEKMSEYYLHIEDDVITIPNYIKIIYSFINLQKHRWTCLEFSELGMIAKLYHTQNLETLAKMVTLFYEEQPADYTYLNFNPQMLQFRRIIRKPTLFQHIGRNSSLPGKIMSKTDSL